MSSTLQHSPYNNTYHKFISDRPWRIVHLSTSPTGIPNPPFLDHHCTHMTGKFGMPLETLQPTTHQNTTISQISGSTPICPNPAVIHTSPRVIQHPGHLQLWGIHSHICNKIVTFQPTTDSYMPQKKFTTFSWRCPQLADWNSYHKGHPQHQNTNKPTYCHPDITTQHPGTYCVHLEYHKVCHTD